MAKKSKTKKAKIKKSVQRPKNKKVVKKAKILNKKVTKKSKKPVVHAEPQALSLLGQQVPLFKIANSKGETVSFNELRGKNIVLYFYPKDDTPGCTLEGHEFSALIPKFSAKNTVVFGVSKDSVESHNKFVCKYNYKVELLSDQKGQLCDFFDVIKEKNMYGKKYMGIERSTFVIDGTGKITKEFRKVSAPGHAQFVLEQI